MRPAPAAPRDTTVTTALSSLRSLPKIIASTIWVASPTSPTCCNAASGSPSTSTRSSSASLPERDTLPPPPSFEDVVSAAAAPVVPPKDVTAPTPTTNPYTWVVPESSAVLEAFLSLIYPRGTFTSSPTALLTDLDITARVARAALGYQSQRGLNLARDRMADFIPSDPVGVYAMAYFFRFTDLAKMASERAVAVPRAEWPRDARALMGRQGVAKLEALQSARLSGLQTFLNRAIEADGHSAACVRRPMIEELWTRKRDEVLRDLKPESELFDLLSLDLRGGHCGDCMILLGTTIKKCLTAARELPRTV